MAGELTMPQLGLTMTEGTVSQWLKQEGDAVKKGDGVVEVETDKINNIVEAPEDGILLKIVAREGDVLPVKGLLGIIGAAGETVNVRRTADDTFALPAIAAANEEVAAVSELSGAIPVQNVVVDGRVLATPYARFLAKKDGINLALVTGSGPNGRIVGDDVSAYKEEHKVRISPAAAKLAAELGVDTGCVQSDGRNCRGSPASAA